MNITVLKSGNSLGPYSLDALRASLLAGEISLTDRGWMPGMADWISLSEFPGLIKRPPPPPPTTVTTGFKIEKVTLSQIWLGYTICMGVLTFFFYLTQFIEVSSTSIGNTCQLLLIGSSFGAAITSSMLIYKSWKRLALDDPPFSPNRAVGLMFIPLFNLYWQFQAVYGLASFLNKITEREFSPTKPQPALLLAGCVLMCWLVIPGFEFLVLLPLSIVTSLGWKGVIETLEIVRPEKS